MRGIQFQHIVRKLRLETYRAATDALGQNEVEHLKQIINRVYEWLWFDFNWPFLKVDKLDLPIDAGSYIYDVPAQIDIERLEKLEVRWGDLWIPVEKGFTPLDYNEIDTDDGSREDPIQRYELRFNQDTDAVQLMFWPNPATDGRVRITGRKKFQPLVENADLCLLDDQLVYLFSAAEILAQDDNKRANAVLGAARRRYGVLKHGLTKNRNSSFNLRGNPAEMERKNIEIRVAHVKEP